MFFKKGLNQLFYQFLIFFLLSISLAAQVNLINDVNHQAKETLEWAYDNGVDPNTKMGKELLDLLAEYPDAAKFAVEFLGKQKLRVPWGINTFRGLLAPNSIKILFMGQEGVHQSEASTRPGGSGFGLRVQAIAWQLGVWFGAATTNSYMNTIFGQYATYNTPYLEIDNGKIKVRTANMVNNNFWLFSHAENSPIAEFRNKFLDWIIRNNKDSLKLIVTMGGGAADGMAGFLKAKGAELNPQVPEEQSKKIVAIRTKLVSAGGNNEFAVPLDHEGNDLYKKVLGEENPNYKDQAVRDRAVKLFSENIHKYLPNVSLIGGGLNSSGLVSTAQIRGYDYGSMKINGKRTRNLKGLPLSDGTSMGDLAVLDIPHPSALARKNRIRTAGKVLTKRFKLLKPYRHFLDSIVEEGMRSSFFEDGKMIFNKQAIPHSHYDFMTPGIFTLGSGQVSRPNKYSIGIGSKTRINVSKDVAKDRLFAKPNEYPEKGQIYTNRASKGEERYHFDRGPGVDLAKKMIQSLDEKQIFAKKRGKSWSKDGVSAFYSSTHPDVKFFGSYRGDLQNPKAVVFADPAGYDDLLTKKALTGARGQYLHGMLEDLGYKHDYAVFKTVPFGMDLATKSDWEYILEKTKSYRDIMYQHLIDTKPEVIFTDGKYAQRELARIAGDLYMPVYNIERIESKPSEGIAKVMKQISPKFSKYKAHAENIPVMHMPLFMRLWWGTTGDRVWPVENKERGKLFITQVPYWAANQNKFTGQDELTRSYLDSLFRLQESLGLPIGQEDHDKHLERIGETRSSCLRSAIKRQL